MYLEKHAKERLELGDRLSVGFQLLGTSQGMVQFADSKAGGLLLIVSVLLTGLVPALVQAGGTVPSGARWLLWAAFGACAIALVESFRVTISRRDRVREDRVKSLVYFAHVARYRNSASYLEAFRESEGERVLESLLESNYELAGIAQTKFAAVQRAERATLGAALLCGLWLLAASLGA